MHCTWLMHSVNACIRQMQSDRSAQHYCACARQVAIFKGPGESKGPVPNSHEAAQFDCIHLLRVMVKLLPTWLPDALFEVLQARWNSRQRLTRCQVNFTLVFTTLNLKARPLNSIGGIFAIRLCKSSIILMIKSNLNCMLHVKFLTGSPVAASHLASLTLQIKHHSYMVKLKITLHIALDVCIEDCFVAACICSHICKHGWQCPRQLPTQLVTRQTHPDRNTLWWCLNLLMLCCYL